LQAGEVAEGLKRRSAVKEVVIISRCTASNSSFSEFHFRGAWQGLWVRGLRVNEARSFVKNEDYALWAEVLAYRSGTLYLRLKKAKIIFDPSF